MNTQIIEKIKDIRKDFENIFPVPIINIANKLGIEVNETEEFSDSKSGSITKEGNKYVIYVNANHPSTRKRFTIAHEIGHFINNKDLIEKKEHIDEVKRPFILNRQKNEIASLEQRKIEIEVDAIAAEILMPEDKFKEVWERSNNMEGVAQYFGVSQSAAAIRAGKLLKSSIF